MLSVAITVAILAALALGALGGYRKLLSLRREVAQAWRLADQRRVARHAAAQRLLAALAGTQGGDPAAYAALLAARQRAANAQRMAEAGPAEDDLTRAAARIAAVLERPAAAIDDEARDAAADLHRATAAFEEARKIYGLTVARHNAALGVFPLSAIGTAAGLEPAEGLD